MNYYLFSQHNRPLAYAYEEDSVSHLADNREHAEDVLLVSREQIDDISGTPVRGICIEAICLDDAKEALRGFMPSLPLDELDYTIHDEWQRADDVLELECEY